MVGTVAAYDVPNYWATGYIFWRACWGNKGQLQNHLLTGFLQFACYDQQLVCCVDDFCMAPMAAWKRWQVVWPTLDCELAAVVRFKLHELAWFDMVWNCFCLPMDCDFNMMSISNISSIFKPDGRCLGQSIRPGRRISGIKTQRETEWYRPGLVNLNSFFVKAQGWGLLFKSCPFYGALHDSNNGPA